MRNNLGVMSNSVYYRTLRLGQEDPKVARHLGILSQQVIETSRPVADLVDFLAPKAPQPTPLHLSDLVKQTVERTTRPPGGPRL